MTTPATPAPETVYDKNERPIASGDLLRTFHFIGARRKRHYLYHTALVRNGKWWMVPTDHMDPTKIKGGGDCLIGEGSDTEIIDGIDDNGVFFSDRPRRGASR